MTSLVGAGTIVEQKEVALAAAGKEALGSVGLVLVSVGALFAAASAINATLFATARLARRVAADGDLPAVAASMNDAGIPDRAVIALGGGAAALAVVGSLATLVEAASLTFLVTFAAVNLIAARRAPQHRLVSWAGATGAGLAGIVLAIRLLLTRPVALAILAALILLAALGRQRIMARVNRSD